MSASESADKTVSSGFRRSQDGQDLGGGPGAGGLPDAFAPQPTTAAHTTRQVWPHALRVEAP